MIPVQDTQQHPLAPAVPEAVSIDSLLAGPPVPEAVRIDSLLAGPPVLEAVNADSLLVALPAMRCDTLYTAEPAADSRYGASGDPVPYTLGTDNVLTVVLLLCFVVYVVTIVKLRHLFARQIKDFFFPPHTDDDAMGETAGELRFMFVLLLVGCLQIAVTSFFYATETIGHDYAVSNMSVVGVLTALLMAYFLAKTILYSIVNVVFFGGKKNLHFLKSVLFATACEGVLLYPIVLLSVFFDLSIQIVTVCSVFVLILNKIICFSKAWQIFFRQKGGFLQTFLYFCALEIIPLLALGVAWMMIVNGLIVNF